MVNQREEITRHTEHRISTKTRCQETRRMSPRERGIRHAGHGSFKNQQSQKASIVGQREGVPGVLDNEF